MVLRISEAQQLYEALRDPLLRPALQEFFHDQAKSYTGMLLNQIKVNPRDTMKEAELAGRVDAYDTAFLELEHYAARMLKEATL